MAKALLRVGKSLLRFYLIFGFGFTAGCLFEAITLLPYLAGG